MSERERIEENRTREMEKYKEGKILRKKEWEKWRSKSAVTKEWQSEKK